VEIESPVPVTEARPSTAPAERVLPHARVERRADGVWVVPRGAAAAQPDAERGPGQPSTSGSAADGARLRVVGPGRRERTWQRREAALEGVLERRRRELATARLVERGSARLADRIEADLARERGELTELRQTQARLLVTFGVLQRENLALRRKLELAEAALPALAEPERERRTLRQRLFGTGRRKVEPPRRARR
jgi:hypothetical protein